MAGAVEITKIRLQATDPMFAGFFPPLHDTRKPVYKDISPHLQAELGWWQGDVANEPPIQEICKRFVL